MVFWRKYLLLDFSMNKITENTVKQLRATLSKLDIALGSINESIAWLNSKGHIEWCNTAFYKMTDKIRIKTLSKSINEILNLTENNEIMNAFQTIRTLSNSKESQIKTCQLITDQENKNVELFSKRMNTLNNEIYYIILIRDVTERDELLDTLKLKNKKQVEYQRKLAVAERRAGMADIASSVLHNIGNVLNSVNVTVTLLEEKISQSKLDFLEDLYNLLKTNESNIDEFFTTNPKGKRVIEYIGKLSDEHKKNKQWLTKQTHLLQNYIEHIKQVVQDQNNLAKLGGVTDEVHVPDLVHEVITMYKNKISSNHILIKKEFEQTKTAYIDQVKVIQILINIVKNSIESLIESQPPNKIIQIKITDEKTHFAIIISDNGIGISTSALKKLFTVQFTTKKQGHGFGLHASAIAAEELGGKIYAMSDGTNQGATITLKIPYKN